VTDDTEPGLDPVDDALAQRLRDAAPEAPSRLRRTVRERVAHALARRALRPRAAAYLASGGALLIAALVAAVSGPH
jgi:hypothetical protein